MRYLLAPDSFKEAASAQAVAESIRRGVAAGDPGAECRMMPLSDGGEGLTDALVQATGGELRSEHAHDALGRPIITRYGFLGEGGFGTSHDGENPRTAVVELAAASGIERISPADRDPLAASTFGTGELIRAAIDAGAERIVLGLGGSATTDGGAGLAGALGISFLDKDGKELEPGGVHLRELASISTDGLLREAAGCEFLVACDVKNHLCGALGAAAVFGPQKGADEEQVKILDAALAHYAAVLKDKLHCAAADTDGSGAAGGLLCGILPYFPVTICSGIDLVLDLTDFDEHVKQADLVITGEGRIDFQSALGKVPVGVAERAKKVRNVPVVAIAGAKGDGCETLYNFGIDAIFDTVPGVMSLEDVMSHAEENLLNTAENVLRLFQIGNIFTF